MRSIQELFQSFTKAHGEFVLTGEITNGPNGPKKEGKGATVPGPITDALWELHLAGKKGIGGITLLDDNEMVWWGAIDVDTYPTDLVALEKDVEALPLIVVESKSGGGHLYIFFKEPVPAKLVQDKLREWAAALGYSKPDQEIFPKQYKRLSNKDMGNWINFPYFGETRWAIIDGQRADLQAFLELADKMSIDKATLEKIQVFTDTGELFKDGPPCLSAMLRTGALAPGGRNNAVVNYALYFKLRYPDQWAEKVHEFNREFVDPPLPQSEINALIQSHERKNYNYTCKKAPLLSHCNRHLCVKREFGVSHGKGGNDEMNVVLSDLVKMTSDPPLYQINIDGVQVNLAGSGELTDQKKLGRIVFEKLDKVYKQVTKVKYDEELQRLLDTQMIVDAPADTSTEGLFIQHFQNFVEKKSSKERDRMANGNVWHDETNNVVYFPVLALVNYLRHEGFRDLNNNEIYRIMKTMGGSHGRFNIKGKTVSWLSCPFNNLQNQEFKTPDYGGDVFGETA